MRERGGGGRGVVACVCTLATLEMSSYWWKLATRYASSSKFRSNCCCCAPISFCSRERSSSNSFAASSSFSLRRSGQWNASHRAEKSSRETSNCVGRWGSE